jgi:hypothetical protein
MTAPALGSVLGNYQQGNPQTAQIEQTTLGQVGKALLEGRSVDLGEGYLPSVNSKVAHAQAEAARKYGPTIGGHGFTLGRFYASLVTEPDTVPFDILSGLVDAKVALSPADISGAALQSSAAARKAAKTFAPSYEAAGLVEGARKGVRRQTAEQWLVSKDGQKVRDFLRDTDDPVEIWRKTNKKIPVMTPDGRRPLVELAAAATDIEVDQILRPILGLDIEGPFGVGGMGYLFKSATSDIRMVHPVPGTKLDPNDLDKSADDLDNWLVNGKVPQVERDPILGRLMRAETGKERIAVGEAAADAVKRQLVRRGVSEGEATRRTRLYMERVSEGTKYFIDEIGSNGWDPIVAVGGEARPLPSPHLLAEQLSGPMYLPEPKAIRRLTSIMHDVDQIPGVGGARQGTAGLLNGFMDLWRDFHLLRPAWTVRVVADEQLRMAASGHDSLFRHPLSYFATVAGAHPDSKFYKLMSKASEAPGAGRLAPTREADIAGAPLFSELNDAAQESLMSSFGAFRPQERSLKHWDVIPREHEDFARGWLGEISQLHADSLVRTAIDETDPALLKQRFWDGDLVPYRTQLSETEDMAAALQTRAGADAYVDSIYKRIEIKTGNDQRLIEAVRTGKLNGKTITRDPGRGGVNEFQRLVDEDVGPRQVKIQKHLTLSVDQRAEDRARLDKVVNTAYDWMLTKPSNTFSRSQEYAQTYWDNVPELVAHTDDAGKAKALVAARQSNMPESVISTIANTEAKGGVSWEVIDKIAQKRGLDATKKLLYDLSERNQFFDVFKLLFPFGDAWKEIITRWSRLTYENPVVARRGQQIIQGARGSGFFHTNTNGEEVFTYPGSEWLTDKLIGVPIPLTGRVEGLNMIGQGLPGVGPAVSIPAAYFLPDTPEWDDVSQLIFPFGKPDTKDPASVILDSLVPAWADKFRTALGNPSRQRDWNNTVMDVARYLASTGEYDLQGDNAKKEQDRLLRDATEKAKWFDFIRGGSQAVAPSAPAPEWQIKDPDGRLILAQKVMNEYRKKQEELGYDEALDWFIKRYGEDNLLAIQPKSKVLVANVPVTKPGMDWARSHSDVVKKFPNTYGFFAPQEGDFDITAYQRQFERGERQMLTVEQMNAEANNRLASHQYKILRDQMPTTLTDAQRGALREFRKALVDYYPGFDTIPYDDKRLPTQVRELQDAVKHRSVAQTDAGKGLKVYLEQRDRVMSAVEQAGLAGFGTAKAAAPFRMFLRAAAEQIIDDHPDFQPLWDSVFSREMKEEEDLGSG